MTDGTPGWFRDPSDSSIARWHDGEQWTDHTLVIADQTPGVEPTPPVITPAEPEPTAPVGMFGASTAFEPVPEPEFHIPRRGGGGLPGWAKVALPLAAVLVAVVGYVLVSGGNDDKNNDDTATVDTRAATLDDAVQDARDAGLPDAVSDAQAAGLIERICGAATNSAAVDQLGRDLAELGAPDLTTLRTTIDALGEGATSRCAAKMDGAPTLIDDLQDQAAVAFSTTTTSPTLVAPTDGGTDAGATVGGSDGGTSGPTTGGGSGSGSTATTKKVTTTTAKPTTTTEALPTGRSGFPCSPSGARARDKNGNPLTCQKKCYSSSLAWTAAGTTCTTAPTTPTTAPGTPPPTFATTTVPSGGTGGSTGGAVDG